MRAPRLAVLLRGVADGQEDREVLRRGPALAAAFDDEGCPTKAAQGFARARVDGVIVRLEEPPTLKKYEKHDIEVIVDGTEVTLDGEVRSRDEKRLAEGLADVRGVTHIQNNLRVGRRGVWR